MAEFPGIYRHKVTRPGPTPVIAFSLLSRRLVLSPRGGIERLSVGAPF